MTTPNLNQLAPISDFDNAYVLAQQAHEQGFRGSTFADLYVWLKSKLDLLGLSNTAGLPDTFPPDGDILSAAAAGQWTILGPGTYHQPGYPSIEVAEGSVVFAQFDGTQFSVQREVEMPVPTGTSVITPTGTDLTNEEAVRNYSATKAELKESIDNALIDNVPMDYSGNYPYRYYTSQTDYVDDSPLVSQSDDGDRDTVSLDATQAGDVVYYEIGLPISVSPDPVVLEAIINTSGTAEFGVGLGYKALSNNAVRGVMYQSIGRLA